MQFYAEVIMATVVQYIGDAISSILIRFLSSSMFNEIHNVDTSGQQPPTGATDTAKSTLLMNKIKNQAEYPVLSEMYHQNHLIMNIVRLCHISYHWTSTI